MKDNRYTFGLYDLKEQRLIATEDEIARAVGFHFFERLGKFAVVVQVLIGMSLVFSFFTGPILVQFWRAPTFLASLGVFPFLAFVITALSIPYSRARSFLKQRGIIDRRLAWEISHR